LNVARKLLSKLARRLHRLFSQEAHRALMRCQKNEGTEEAGTHIRFDTPIADAVGAADPLPDASKPLPRST
jgi:hypothetical protein